LCRYTAGCRAAATRVLHAYAAVADWDGLDSLRAQVDAMRAEAAAEASGGSGGGGGGARTRSFS
jgi:hypothetical protein